jgi:hypothetical protein
MANCGINVFLFVIHRFSLVKAAMNALLICKLHNGAIKTPQFLLFPTAKGGTKTIGHLPIGNSPLPFKLLYNCQLKNKEVV